MGCRAVFGGGAVAAGAGYTGCRGLHSGCLSHSLPVTWVGCWLVPRVILRVRPGRSRLRRVLLDRARVHRAACRGPHDRLRPLRRVTRSRVPPARLLDGRSDQPRPREDGRHHDHRAAGLILTVAFSALLLSNEMVRDGGRMRVPAFLRACMCHRPLVWRTPLGVRFYLIILFY